MLPFLAPLALGAGQAILKRVAGGGRRKPQAPNPLRQRFDSAVGALGTQGQQVTDDYLARMRGFDPRKGWEDATRARLDAHDEGFARTYADRVGSLVGAGRSPYRSGYGVRDVQDTIAQGQRTRANIEQQGAGEASNAYGSYLNSYGAFGADARNRYLDAVGGRLDTEEGQRLQDAASKRGMWGAIGGGILGSLPEYLRYLPRGSQYDFGG